MRRSQTLAPDYFEQMYRDAPDPWRFETSAYERAKYDATIAALGRRAYAHGLEVGCSIGVLTERLAGQCADLLALDVSETALAAARVRCQGRTNVRFEDCAVPAQHPSATGFDLIILSEVVYYWDPDDCAAAARWLGSALEKGGDMLLVHWTGETDYPQSADDAVASFRAGLSVDMTVITEVRTSDYRLDLWRRSAGQGCATAA